MLHYDEASRSVSIVWKTTLPIAKSIDAPIGLVMFYDKLCNVLNQNDVRLYIRERPFGVFHVDADRLYRVAGLSDLALFQIRKRAWIDMVSSHVKKIITGAGNATKDDVANRLAPYVGEQEYETNDESDAVAVGVAYLIREGYLDAAEFDTVSSRKHTR